ncbi:unnamed protein product [Staurois parvus]|uniref:Uncharacterized protein n=1 Tax=Staurois parvus TaxID=386267 RepID=A0ABN9FZ42_9NEOB|nr:unnamed protein product [Staurois parvus]
MILVILVNVTFCHFRISRRSVPVRPDARRGRNPDDRWQHAPDYIAGDTAGWISRGVQDKVSDGGIAEQRRRVFPSVDWGYHLCYTREYRQGG